MNDNLSTPTQPSTSSLLQSGHAGAFVKDGFGPLPAAPHATSHALAGLTLAVKDVFDVCGLRTGAGNPQWQRGRAAASCNASAVETLLRAGARWVGKTVTDELAYSLAGNNIHYGTPENPAAPLRIPGGSSSGSAVAVAGGYADIGLATDCGGSARLPASYCGVWGIRPSHGLVGGVSGFPLAPSYDTVGWFARDGDVIERVLELLAPAGPGAVPLGWFAARDALDACDASVAQAYGALVMRLQARTSVHWCDRGVLALSDWAAASRTLQGAEVWSQHGAWVHAHPSAMAPAIRTRFDTISKIGTRQVLSAEATRDHARATLGDLFDRHGLWVVPTAPGAAPLLTASEDELARTRERCHLLLAPAGLAGLPQVSLPWTHVDGAPVGISVIGPRGHDQSVMAAARTLERVISETA